jgi:hypothetical protein
LIKLGLNIGQVGTNGVMTHVLVMSIKIRRIEQLK